jgi:hypothetical protein
MQIIRGQMEIRVYTKWQTRRKKILQYVISAEIKCLNLEKQYLTRNLVIDEYALKETLQI